MIDVGNEWIAWDSYLSFKVIGATPVTPETNYLRVYAKDKAGVSALYLLDDAGSEREIAPANQVTGIGVANRLAYWTSTSVVDDVPRTLTAGSVLFVHSDLLPQEDNTNFFWDDTNNRLGLGTASPAVRLHVAGANDTELVRISATNTLFSVKETVADSAVYFTLGTSGQTNVFVNVPESLIFNIDSDNGQTDRSFLIKKDTAINTGGTSLFSVSETGDVGACLSGGNLVVGGGTTASELRLLEPSASGTNYTAFKAQAQAGNITYILPPADGTPGQQLQTDGAFNLSWGAAGVTDHGALTGLTDDDHAGAAWLAGRSGGQTLIGGTAAADDLTLRATAGVGAGSETVVVQVGNNGSIEPARFGQNASGGVLVCGSTGLTTTSASTLVPKFIVTGAGVGHFANIVRHTSIGGGGASFGLYATRGTGVDTHSAVQTGDGIGQLAFEGSDGTRFVVGALIRATVATTFITDTPIANLLFLVNDGVSPSTPAVRLTIGGASGSARIGTSAPASNGTLVLEFEDGTAPTAMGTNSAGIYANDVAGTVEMFAIDEAAAATQLSSHNFTLFTPDVSYEYPWSFYSRHSYLGKEIGVDMFGAIRALEQLTGKQFIYLRDLPPDQIRDWNADQRANFQRMAGELARWEALSEDDQRDTRRPPAPQMKPIPSWIATRINTM